MKLYSYFRSSAAYRVRIALNLKQLPYQTEYIHLVNNGGEQKQPAYVAINPQKLVPSLQINDHILTQSLAIIEYLEELHPQIPLLPTDAEGRARVRALSQLIACDVHPLNNLRVMQYLEQHFSANPPAKKQWYAHWIAEGLEALEVLLQSQQTGRFCHGDAPTIADCCLIPQLYNAHRFECDLSPYPIIRRIEQECAALTAFQNAAPEQQPDANF